MNKLDLVQAFLNKKGFIWKKEIFALKSYNYEKVNNFETLSSINGFKIYDTENSNRYKEYAFKVTNDSFELFEEKYNDKCRSYHNVVVDYSGEWKRFLNETKKSKENTL